MKAALLKEHGPASVLSIEEIPEPTPDTDEVAVAVRACGLNRLDIHIRNGLEGIRVPLPHILGSDIAGELLTPSSDGRWAIGERVVIAPGVVCGACRRCLSGDDQLCSDFSVLGGYRLPGGYAEVVCVPSRNLVRIPPVLSFETAAALPVSYMTAWEMVVRQANVGSGDRVLVRSGSGGIGLACVKIASAMGAHVFATTSSPAKVDAIRAAGAETVLVSGSARDVEKSLGRRTLDAVFDHVGTADLTDWFRLLCSGGCYSLCGASGAFDARADLRVVFSRSIRVLGSSLGRRVDFDSIVDRVAGGALAPLIDATYPLEDVREAHEHLERGVIGKIVLSVNSGTARDS
ncbi:MAG: alcohol dehydrogenase catalytic domain-containing protein [Actinomycetota bacterium]|nr:alcohol dehydrogenase catalytic domain-containing protein [Actinomycetota bacterium]